MTARGKFIYDTFCISLEAFLLFHCNYDVKDIPIASQFYSEILKLWSDFREEFGTERDQQNIVWNNKEIRINNKPVFYKNFFESGIIYVNDLLFHLTGIRLTLFQRKLAEQVS